MIKIVRFVKRRKDLTQEQFKAYWLNKHSKLEKIVVEKTPVKRIIASFVTGEMIGGEEPPFDGMVELYYNSVEDMRAAFAGDIPAMMRKDEENFVDLSEKPVRVVTEEYVMSERTGEKQLKVKVPIKIARFVKRRKDLTQEQFKAYWLNEHSKLEKIVVEKTPVKRIVASFVTGEMIGGEEPPFDGMVELYYNSVEDMRAAFAGNIPAMMRKDEENFVDLSEKPVRVVTEEYVMSERKGEKLT